MWTSRNLKLSNLSTFSINVEGGVLRPLISSEVRDHLLGPGRVQVQGIAVISSLQVLDLLSVGCFIVICDQSYDCGVVRKCNYGVAGVNGGTVMCVKGVEDGAENALLCLG